MLGSKCGSKVALVQLTDFNLSTEDDRQVVSTNLWEEMRLLRDQKEEDTWRRRLQATDELCKVLEAQEQIQKLSESTNLEVLVNFLLAGRSSS